MTDTSKSPNRIWVHNIIARGILPVGGKSEHVSIALTKDNNCNQEYILNTPAAMLAAGYMPVGQILARNQPCGCIICYCADEEQCHGCGAKNCGAHPIGEFPAPAYVTASADQAVSVDREAIARALWLAHEDEYTFDDALAGQSKDDDIACLHKSSLEYIYELADAAISALTTQPAPPDIDAPQNVYSGAMVDAAFEELDALRKKYAAACASSDGYKADLHKALECSTHPGTETITLAAERDALQGKLDTQIKISRTTATIVLERDDRLAAVKVKLDVATEALREVASFTQTTNLLWWQKTAIAALSAIKEPTP